MIDPTPHEPAAEEVVDSPAPAPARGYALIALVSVGTLVLARQGAAAIILGGAATSAIYLYGFLRLPPRLVGIELIVLTLLGYVFMPKAPVYWMMGSALGGGIAAMLTLRDGQEDDHFFLPALGAALGTFILFTAGQPGGWAASLAVIGDYVAHYGEAIEVMLAMPDYAELRDELHRLERWDQLQARLGLIMTCALIALWMMVFWLFGRVARRRAGRGPGVMSSLMLFHIRPGYTFLLIAALIFEILGTWLDRDGLRMVSYPLFAACGAAFLMVHLGLVMFLAMARRALYPDRPSIMFNMMIILGLALAFYIGPVIGLIDVWMDFRKTRRIRDRLT